MAVPAQAFAGNAARRLFETTDSASNCGKPVKLEATSGAQGPVEVVKLDDLPDVKQTSTVCDCCDSEVFPTDTYPCQAGHRFCKTCIADDMHMVVDEFVLIEKEKDWGLNCFAAVDPRCPSRISRDLISDEVPARDVLDKFDSNMLLNVLKLDVADKRKDTKMVICKHCQRGFDIGVRQNILPKDLKLGHECPSCCLRCDKEHKTGHRYECPANEGAANRGANVGTAAGVKSSALGKRKRGKTLSHEEERERQYVVASTNAVTRKCPTCDAIIVKDDGCNKIHCRKCCTNFCFICRHKLGYGEGYDHFVCQCKKLGKFPPTRKSEGTKDKCSGCGVCRQSNKVKRWREARQAEVDAQFGEELAQRFRVKSA